MKHVGFVYALVKKKNWKINGEKGGGKQKKQGS